MQTIGIHEAKTHLSAILKRVAAGEEFVITNRGEEVARMVPPNIVRRSPEESIAALRRLAKQAPLAATIEEVITWKNEGRT